MTYSHLLVLCRDRKEQTAQDEVDRSLVDRSPSRVGQRRVRIRFSNYHLVEKGRRSGRHKVLNQFWVKRKRTYWHPWHPLSLFRRVLRSMLGSRPIRDTLFDRYFERDCVVGSTRDKVIWGVSTAKSKETYTNILSRNCKLFNGCFISSFYERDYKFQKILNWRWLQS